MSAGASRPMAGFDSLMWGLESQPRMRSWIVALLVLEEAPDEALLRDRFAELAAQVPRLRSTVLASPRPLAARRWLVHDSLEVGSVFSRVSLADVPGGLPALLAATADGAYRPGDPVWSVQLVDGLPDDRAGLMVRLHHSVTDGAGAMVMAGLFFESDAQGTRLMERAPAAGFEQEVQAPGTAAVATGAPARAESILASVQEDAATAWELGRKVGAVLPGVVAGALADPGGALAGLGGYAASLARLMTPAPVPLSPVMTEHRAESGVRLLDYPVDELKRAARVHGGRLNDVYVAGALIGLRRYHESLGVAVAEIPELRIYVPVNTRPADDASAGGNQFTPLRVELPLTGASPAEVVAGVRERLTAGRAEPALGSGAVVTEVMGRMPEAVAGRLVSGMFYGLDACVTNVPGPPMPLWIGRRRVEGFYALAPRSGASLCTCLLSYAGTAYVTVNADVGAVTDLDLLTESLREGLDQVLAAPGAAG